MTAFYVDRVWVRECKIDRAVGGPVPSYEQAKKRIKQQEYRGSFSTVQYRIRSESSLRPLEPERTEMVSPLEFAKYLRHGIQPESKV